SAPQVNSQDARSMHDIPEHVCWKPQSNSQDSVMPHCLPLHAASLQLVVSSRRQSPSGARHFPQLVVSSLHVAASHPSELAPPAPPIPPLVAGSSPMSSQLSSDGTPASHCSPSSTSPLPQTEQPSVTQPSPSASQVAFPPLNASGS